MPIAFGSTPITSVSRGANAIASAALERLGFPGQTATVFSAISPPDAPTNVAITVEEDFSPSYITGLQAWWDASDTSTITESGGAVSQVDDKSGNDYHLTQSTGASQPSLVSGAQNGLDVLRFDGSDDFLSVPSSTATFKFLHETQASFFAVCKAGTTANPDTFMFLAGTDDGATANIGAAFYYDDRTTSLSRNDRFRVTTTRGVEFQTVANSGTTSAAEDSLPANTYAVVTAIVDNTDGTAANRVATRLNGGTVLTDNSNTGTPSSSNSSQNFSIGKLSVGSMPALDGDICEIIMYDTALSDTDREAVENYLLAKWGIT